MKLMQSRKEKDFEFFVKALPSLEAVEFAGLAKILGVKMVNSEVDEPSKQISDDEEYGPWSKSMGSMRPR